MRVNPAVCERAHRVGLTGALHSAGHAISVALADKYFGAQQSFKAMFYQPRLGSAFLIVAKEAGEAFRTVVVTSPGSLELLVVW